MIILIVVITLLVLFHLWLSLANPYAARFSFVKQPYSTYVKNGRIGYRQHFKLRVHSGRFFDLLGYYRSGFLIVQNTLIGGKRINLDSADSIIAEIHRQRFDPSKPYLISGDQFSVLYPRNLGVFYNQLLDPKTAHSQTDWENRQRIYLQSVLYAIDGLSDATIPKTTLVPMGRKIIVTTRVHPTSIASDATYGVLYALDKLLDDGHRVKEYPIQTGQAAGRILAEKKIQLKHMVDVYLAAVQDEDTGMLKPHLHVSSARDGVIRDRSFYDTVILWKTMQLADKLGIRKTPAGVLKKMHKTIKQTYWDEKAGYYRDALNDDNFSSDWLIGYVTGFFDLKAAEDLERTRRIIKHIDSHKIDEPLPIRYQDGEVKNAPFFVRTFVPQYGSEAIWSYWGAQYITLLADMAAATGDKLYYHQAERHVRSYEKVIVRDGGFAETFDRNGNFLRIGPYKSIRITGWVVQFEHARARLKNAK